MNVLFLSQIVPYPPHGGVLQRGYNLLRMSARRNKIHLLAFVHPDVLGTEPLLEESRRELGKFCSSVEFFTLWPKKSKFHKFAGFALSCCSTLPFSVLAHSSRPFRARFEELASSDDIDLIHFDTIALAEVDCPGIRKPKVLTHHNIESVLMARRAAVEKNPVLRAYLRRQARRLEAYEKEKSPLFACNILVSGEDESKLRAAVPGITTAIVPNGVDTDYFRPVLTDERPAVVYAGGMNMFANKDAVLFFLKEIWPLIKRSRPESEFYAIGQCPPAELLEYAKGDSSVTAPGYVDDVRPFISRAAVYVIPLRIGGGTRLKLLDAMAMGKAIVSTSIGCEGIEAADGKELLVADSPADFAARVLDLLKDEPKRRALGSAARRAAEAKYSWESIGLRLQEAYEDAQRRIG
ncbi:MAG: glycosyltransferase [Deltaproteobacteria bacterium]|nr:glycosyltransferase [Deltaproteobacteria bacterium]MCL4874162.1 glycosyltransferase [bacterium]